MSVNGSGGKYAAVPGAIPGTPLNLGGMLFIFPPLNFAQLERYEELLPKLGQAPSLKENIAEALPVIHACLSRNYPELTLDELRDLLDCDNFPKACAAVAHVSGYTEAATGEPRPAGQ